MRDIQQFAQTYKIAILTGFVGMILGIIIFVGVRLLFQPNDQVHYHANFAVFIDGKRQEFKDFRYFEEVQSCAAHDTPRSRVHMHDNNDHIVHVHDFIVTWADFFTNIGWSLNDTLLFDGKTAYSAPQFVLNGQKTSSSDQQLQDEFAQIQSDAAEANKTQDPASCKGSEDVDFWAKTRRALWY
jgi:hypothetical protein